ncbi:MAG: patatin-like phospholipase family protein [Chloroflexia bacterium]
MSDRHSGARIKSGLVLGGGGARGLAHVGVLQVLEREGYPIDVIAGTSMGALIGCMYGVFGSSAGLLGVIEQGAAVSATGWSRAPRAEMFESRHFRRWLGGLFAGRTFADLRWPTGVTAVDIDTAEEFALTQGPVAPAVWAATAIPGVYAPVEINGRRLVDGGVLNPVPVDLAKRLGASVTIAVDVLPESDRPTTRMPQGYRSAMMYKLPATMELLSKAFDIVLAVQRDNRLRECPPDLLITPNLRGVGSFAYHRAQEVVEIGVAAAEAVLPQIRLLRDQLLEGRAQPENGHRKAPLPAGERVV